jgi:hypothetical protein
MQFEMTEILLCCLSEHTIPEGPGVAQVLEEDRAGPHLSSEATVVVLIVTQIGRGNVAYLRQLWL